MSEQNLESIEEDSNIITKSNASSKTNLVSSQSNLASKSNLASGKSFGSKGNLMGKSFGSKGNLMGKSFGSKGNLMGSNSNLLKSRKNSQVVEKEKPQGNAVVFENTYRLKPLVKFAAGEVTRLINAALHRNLEKVKYDHEKLPELIAKISNELLAEIKSILLLIELNYERYKIVVQIEIGEHKGQGVKVASRCIWDTTTDTWASGNFRNVFLINKGTLFAVCMVFGCYFE
jgi:hypothetical protein